MSKQDEGRGDVEAEECGATGAQDARLESYPNRAMKLGTLEIERALPIGARRLVGAWCFLDRFGPLSFTTGRPMDVAPHPHIGLQTVSWLLEGEVAHDDSLGCEAVARPGAVNVMTAGQGISHAEWTPTPNGGRLDGVQLWVALPSAQRAMAPAFEHVQAGVAELRGGLVRVFAGGLAGATSPARYHSPIVGAELTVHAGSTARSVWTDVRSPRARCGTSAWVARRCASPPCGARGRS
jgi:redox-sensitive bicupin YhaK (pirin superfamily)